MGATITASRGKFEKEQLVFGLKSRDDGTWEVQGLVWHTSHLVLALGGGSWSHTGSDGHGRAG